MIKFNSKTFQFNFATFLFTLAGKLFYTGSLYGTKYFRMDQINFFKSCLPQTFLGPFLNTLSHIFGSSHPKVFCKKGVLRNFAKFTGTHLCQSPFLIKLQTPATLLKIRLWHRYFYVNFAKFLRTPFFTEYLWWRLL